MALSQDQDEETKKYLMSSFQDPQLTDSLTKGSSDQMRLPPVSSPIPPTPVAPVPVEKEAPQPNDERIQDSHPGNQPEDLLANDIQGKITQSQKYGPDQEQAVLDNIMKSQGSLGNRLSRAGAGLGDAIMGVAGKQSPGFLNSLENREAGQNKMALDSIPALSALNKEKMGEKQALEGMTSSTPLGKATAQAYQKVFKQLFPQMSQAELTMLTKNPSIAAKIFPDMAPIIDKQVQNELKKEQIEATIGNQKQQRELEERKTKMEAAKDVMAGSKIPFVGPTHTEKLAASRTLGQLAGGSPEPSQSHGIPDLGSTFNGHKVIGVKRIK